MLNENALNIVINALAAGSIIMPLALGFSLIMRTLRFADFALGGYALLSAWFFYFYSSLGYSVYISLLLSTASAGLLAAFFDVAVYRRIRKKEKAALLLSAASFATFALLREAFVFLYDKNFSLSQFSLPVSGKFFMILISFFSLILLFLIIKITRAGKALSALSAGRNAIELAEASGIDTQKLISAGMIMAGSLAGISGILANFESGIDIDSGAMLLIKAFAASILISESLAGAAAGSLLIGFLETSLEPFYSGIAVVAAMLSVLYIRARIKSEAGGYEHESA